jgi:hypothetical protein
MFGSKRPASGKPATPSPAKEPARLDQPLNFEPGGYDKMLDSFAALQYGSPRPSRRDDLQFSAVRSKFKAHPTEASQKLIATLPKDLSLLHLYTDFPHVLNKLSAAWPHPHVFYALVDQFLLDRRGDRQGFPFRVAMELNRLSEHYAQYVAPRKVNAWDVMETARRANR